MPAPSNKRPTPCIVLGLETQISLGIVRELGRAGIPVIGITDDPSAIALASRYMTRKIVIQQPRSDELIECLHALGKEYGDIKLLTVSEGNLKWLLANKERFEKVHPLLPDAEALAIVLDKQRTLAIAQKVGISIPLSATPKTLQELEALAKTFPFPAVLKWPDPNVIAPLLSRHQLELIKTEYAYNAEDLLAIGRRYEPLGQWPMIQEYCVGQGLGLFFFMHKGQAVRRFQHLRIAEWPPEGGYSSVCDGVPLDQHKDLQEKSISLLQAIGWEGVAMVEYRFDNRTGRAVLMEINGRFWGSFPLAVHSEARFAQLAYSLQGYDQMPVLPAVQENLRCRMIVTETKRLIRILLQPGKILDRSFSTSKTKELSRFITDFFRPRVRYFVWARDDMSPFWRDLHNMLNKTLR